MRRTLTVAMLAVLLTGCGAILDASGPNPADARAHSRDGGVEVWDLRGRPSGAAFGATGDELTPTYYKGRARDLRLLLPGERTLDVPNATSLSFVCSGADEPDCGRFGVTTSSDPSTGLSSYYDCLDELRLPRGTGTQFEIDIAVAYEAQDAHSPGESPVESPEAPFESTRLDQLSVGCSAKYDPDADLVRLDVSGRWHQ